MAYGYTLVRHAALIALAFGLASSTALAERAPADEAPGLRSLPMDEQPLTSFEKMELHHRRYSSAANNIAQLFKQLNQKAQEVVLAARTAEAKDNSQNRRQLELKMRQLDSASSTYGVQYSQLQAQMQNEYRNYMALSNDLKGRYVSAKEGKDAPREATDAKAKPGKSKDQKKEQKEQKDLKEKEARVKGEVKKIKAKEGRADEMQAKAATSSVKDPRIMDLDTAEVRARRDGLKGPGSAAVSGSTPGPTLNTVR